MRDRSLLELSRIGVLSGGFRLAVEPDDFNLAWQLLVELRKEILETQKIRSQVIGFKITFISTVIGLILASNTPIQLLTIPAFSA